MNSQTWRPTAVVVTCEHAGNEVPAEYAHLFRDAGEVLASHRGWDPGTLSVGTRLASALSAPLLLTLTTRLLVEANRSLGMPGLFSAYTAGLPTEEQQRIIDDYYTPHRAAVVGLITALTDRGERVLHLGVHSFTDVLNGQTRDFELGLLFDPERVNELSFCTAWHNRLAFASTRDRIRFNEPYLGTDDGLTTSLRTVFDADAYAGIEIELRQGTLASEIDRSARAAWLASSVAPLMAHARG